MKQAWFVVFVICSLLLGFRTSPIARAQDDVPVPGALVPRTDGEQIANEIVAQRTVFPEQSEMEVAEMLPQANSPELSVERAHRYYLPLVHRSTFITGRVLLRGAPSKGEIIELRSSGETVRTIHTDAKGAFTFVNPPVSYKAYHVRYVKSSPANTDRLSWYYTRSFIFTGRASVDLGSFDIANIELKAPVHEATVQLPRTFQWIPRAATNTVDSYMFVMRRDAVNLQQFTSNLLGYVDNYTLNTRLFSNGLATQTYFWYVAVYNPGTPGNQPFGFSSHMHAVTVQN